MFDVTASTAALLPAARPRYFMGIGDPEGILRVIGAGIDMFDCVLPTRLGRTGSATTWEGRLNLRNARFARDDRPLQEGCECPACTRFSRAYVRHLVTQDELLGLRLLTLHNLSFLLELCRGARRAIIEHRFAAFAAAALERLGSGTARGRRARRGGRSERRGDHARLDRRHRAADVVPLHPPAAAHDGAAARVAAARSRPATRWSRSAASTASSRRSAATRCASRSPRRRRSASPGARLWGRVGPARAAEGGGGRSRGVARVFCF